MLISLFLRRGRDVSFYRAVSPQEKVQLREAAFKARRMRGIRCMSVRKLKRVDIGRRHKAQQL
jgi:hypothetical protein